LKKVPDSLIMRLNKGQLSDPTGALRYPPRPSSASAAPSSRKSGA
jgi:cell division transport system ATP-binding protein